ncbi:hypothetical protein Acsp04_21310 [Actinomadura sp. NBRC 104425]|nr:hypothetical protein Acsp04_21310 [Actinomadura sp. NBRC 104425]
MEWNLMCEGAARRAEERQPATREMWSASKSRAATTTATAIDHTSLRFQRLL